MNLNNLLILKFSLPCVNLVKHVILICLQHTTMSNLFVLIQTYLPSKKSLLFKNIHPFKLTKCTLTLKKTTFKEK